MSFVVRRILTVIYVILVFFTNAYVVNAVAIGFDPMVNVYTDGQRVVKLGLGHPWALPDGDAGSSPDNSIRCLDFGNSSLMDAGTNEGSIRMVDAADLSMLFHICHTLTAARQSTHRHKRFIIPGTKWCGLGNVASDYTDLGSAAGTDRCCRTHDHCPDHIAPFATKNGITNWSILYRFNCACEERFFDCLKEVSNQTPASLVGRLYFNLLQPKCFKIDHPTKCDRKGWWFTCKHRVMDTSKPKEWRFYKFWKSF